MKALILAAALLLPVLAPAAPEAQTRRFLLRMEADGRLAAHAVVDAYTRSEAGRVLDWQLSVTYYLAGRAGRADGVISRNYSSSSGNRAGTDNVGVELSPYGVKLTLPTPGGDRAIPVQGAPDAAGKWNLHGSARAKGKGGAWSVSSVRRIQAGRMDLKD